MGLKAARIVSLPHIKGGLVAAVVALSCVAAGLVMTFHVAGLVQDIITSQHQQKAYARLSEARARLEGELGTAIALGSGLRGYVIQDELTQFEFERFGSQLIDDVPFIRSVALAPKNVIRYIYPREGNERVIGLDYRENADQWPAIKQAMIDKVPVVSGPINLIQGGHALLVRIPVFPPAYLQQPMAGRSYWGVASLVIDEVGLFSAAGFSDLSEGYRFAIFSAGEQGGERSLVFGDDALQELDAISMPLVLAGDLKWEILSYPDGGWVADGVEVWMTRIFGVLITSIIAAMAFLLILEVFKVRRMALRDPLTGLANRRLLQDRMQQLAALGQRRGDGFDIFYIDLDDFKPVNDNHGHLVGDEVLKGLAERLLLQIRGCDTLARVGGDEFILMTPGTMSSAQRELFVDRIKQQIETIFLVSDAEVAIRSSIGVASYPADSVNIEELLRIADMRMYAEKNQPSIDDVAVPVRSCAGMS